MKILVVGAGAVGGHFDGRLIEAGRDGCFSSDQGVLLNSLIRVSSSKAASSSRS